MIAADEVVKEIIFEWMGGAVVKLTKSKRGLCVLCGKNRRLTHEKVSGGQKVNLCDHCVENYVARAKKLQCYKECGIYD